MTAPACTFQVSHDGSNWTDLATVAASQGGGWRCFLGRNRALAEWAPGTISLNVRNRTRVADPTNQAATFQMRPGDQIRVIEDAHANHIFRGFVDAASNSYRPTGTAGTPDSLLTVLGSCPLSRLNRADVQPAGVIHQLADEAIKDMLDNTGSWLYSIGRSVTGSSVYLSNAVPSGTVLGWVQKATLTEGGASRLYSTSAGVVVWKGRQHRPTDVVAFGGSGEIPISDIGVDVLDTEWANYVTVTADSHTDTMTSSTSITPGTGSKTFTVGAGFDVSANATISIVSSGAPTATMTGTVTSYTSTTLIVNVTAFTGAGAHTDWQLTYTEAATAHTVYDVQSFDRYGAQYRKDSLSTLHETNVTATAEAYTVCAERANPRNGIAWIEVELAVLTSAQQNTVLALSMADAAEVTFALGSGTPSTLNEIRLIDGIEHNVDGYGSHRVRFYLGRVATMDFTAVVKQNGATIASTTNHAVYTVRDGWCSGHFSLSITAAGTNNTELKVTATGLPAGGASNAGYVVGFFAYVDAGTAVYRGTIDWDGTDLTFGVHNAALVALGQTPTFAAANGDSIYGTFTYHSA